MTILFCDAEQGTDEWAAARLGFITASRINDVRDRLKDGRLSAKASLYAQDVARERCGGKPERVFVSYAMQAGMDAEEAARTAYWEKTDNLPFPVGFAFAFDQARMYGCSPDGLVGDDGMIEIKTLVGSASLFRVLVDGDLSGYLNQIQFSLYLLGREWCDLVLWTPDFGLVKIIRIFPDATWIATMMAEVDEFSAMVDVMAAELALAIERGEEAFS